MAIKFGQPLQAGGGIPFEIEYVGPYAGLHVQAPENLIPDNASPSMSGVQLRNAELRSTPPFPLKFPSPDSVNPFLGQYSFIDLNAVTHTVAWSARGLWQLAGNTPPSAASWSYLGGPLVGAATPISYRSFLNILYYSNGVPAVGTWDGTTQLAVGTQTFSAANGWTAGDNTVAASAIGIQKANAPNVVSGTVGPLSLGAFFLGELDNHLILANVLVLDQNGVNASPLVAGGQAFPLGSILTFPQSVWWSANGLPTFFDPVFNTNAGFTDFLDVPDNITGMVTLGAAGYIFRTNGITQFTPTGQGIVPFQFDHLWGSDHGVGNIYPWSIHSYGAFCCFVSAEQIYQMGINSFTDIGGTARDAIMADLSIASAIPVASVVPTEGLGYVYLTYRISIPLRTFTREYLYSFEAKTWEVRDKAGLIQTGREEEIWTGQLSSLPVGFLPVSTGVAGGSQPSGGNTPGGGGGSGGGSRGGFNVQ